MNAEVKTVLLVDDEPANIKIVNSILKDIYKTRIATKARRPWNLLMKIHLPI
jgi:CheY-like chemotaxis protein